MAFHSPRAMAQRAHHAVQRAANTVAMAGMAVGAAGMLAGARGVYETARPMLARTKPGWCERSTLAWRPTIGFAARCRKRWLFTRPARWLSEHIMRHIVAFALRQI